MMCGIDTYDRVCDPARIFGGLGWKFSSYSDITRKTSAPPAVALGQGRGGAGGLAAWIDAGTGPVRTTNAQESDRGGFGCGSFVPTMD